jgi:hypothetical protein
MRSESTSDEVGATAGDDLGDELVAADGGA